MLLAAYLFRAMSYLTITIERKNFEEAKAQFATLEATIHKAFIELGAEIVPLNGNERLKVLYNKGAGTGSHGFI